MMLLRRAVDTIVGAGGFTLLAGPVACNEG